MLSTLERSRRARITPLGSEVTPGVVKPARPRRRAMHVMCHAAGEVERDRPMHESATSGECHRHRSHWCASFQAFIRRSRKCLVVAPNERVGYDNDVAPIGSPRTFDRRGTSRTGNDPPVGRVPSVLVEDRGPGKPSAGVGRTSISYSRTWNRTGNFDGRDLSPWPQRRNHAGHTQYLTRLEADVAVRAGL